MLATSAPGMRLLEIAAFLAVLCACDEPCKCELDDPRSCASSSDWMATTVVTGTFREGNGAIGLELVVDTFDDVALERPEIVGGTLVDVSGAGSFIALDDGTSEVDVAIAARCGGDKQVIRAVVAVPADPRDGDAALVARA